MSHQVGVLCIQGGFAELIESAHRCGHKPLEVRTADDLARCHSLLLPGGESTVILGAAMPDSLRKALESFKGPMFGVCAGLIVLSKLKLLHIDVERNFYGSQKHSAIRKIAIETMQGEHLNDTQFFIRAPAITSVGDGVRVIAHDSDIRKPCAVFDAGKKILATTFHPEISGDDSWMRLFLGKICGLKLAEAATTPLNRTLTAPWCPTPGQEAVKRAFPLFSKGGVIMDVVTPEQARVAEAAGAVAVMALERIPADIKKDGGIARTSDPAMIRGIVDAVSIPVMAKARIGHFAEAQAIEAIPGVDCIDESEVLTAADELHHIDKRNFTIPFVCGAKDLGEALRRIAEGAAMIRVKGNAGTGNVMHAVRHARTIMREIRTLKALEDDEVFEHAKTMQVPLDLLLQTRALGRLPVVLFAAGGLATPADVSLLMQLGVDGVFVGSGIFKGDNPAARARAMVRSATHYRDPRVIAEASTGLGKAMVGILDQGESYVTTNFDSKL